MSKILGIHSFTSKKGTQLCNVCVLDDSKLGAFGVMSKSLLCNEKDLPSKPADMINKNYALEVSDGFINKFFEVK